MRHASQSGRNQSQTVPQSSTKVKDLATVSEKYNNYSDSQSNKGRVRGVCKFWHLEEVYIHMFQGGIHLCCEF